MDDPPVSHTPVTPCALALQVFKYLQIISAAAMSFAHGANDVANAVGPFAAIYGIYQYGFISPKSTVEPWMLAGIGATGGWWCGGKDVGGHCCHRCGGEGTRKVQLHPASWFWCHHRLTPSNDRHQHIHHDGPKLQRRTGSVRATRCCKSATS